MMLPDRFVQRMRKELEGDEYEKFISSLQDPPPTSVRTHALKTNSIPVEIPVPWCDLGFYLKERPIFTLDPSFHAGTYYVQEASSMLIWQVLEKMNLDTHHPVILDLCAAPGGKSSMIANFLKGRGTLIANETVKARANILKYNLLKEGYANVIVTQNDPSHFTPLSGVFDVIFADVPCSGEGMFRKDPASALEWSYSHVELCCTRQQRIIADILPTLSENGYLVYSTCTYNHQENIDNIHWICENFGMESISLDFPSSWNITEVQKKQSFGYQCFPHRVNGEGFFMAVLRNRKNNLPSRFKTKKPSFSRIDRKHSDILRNWLDPESHDILTLPNGNIYIVAEHSHDLLNLVASRLWIIQAGITAGNLKNHIFLPDHALALSLIPLKMPKIELEKSDALLYLKKELPAVAWQEKTWALVCFNGNNIGWIKNLGDRINNYLPTHYRILMEIK